MRSLWIAAALLAGCASTNDAAPSDGQDLKATDDGTAGRNPDLGATTRDGAGVGGEMSASADMGPASDMSASSDLGSWIADQAIPPDLVPPPLVAQVWVIFDSNAVRADLEGEMDCLINHTNFNDLIDSFNSSPYGGLRVQWAPAGGANGHGGSMVTAYPGQCGQLYSPNAQCLTDLVRNNANLGVPANGDIFLYVVHGPDQCGGGNVSGDGVQVQGPAGTIYVHPATIADGWGYNPCQERVAMHELFEATTMVSSADCCTGQTPGNLGDDCSPQCAQYTSVGPAGYGSYTLICPNGQMYAGQQVEKWSTGTYPPWQPSGCTSAQLSSVASQACWFRRCSRSGSSARAGCAPPT